MSTKSLSPIAESPGSSSPLYSSTGRVAFRYVWTTRIAMRQLNDNEAMILHVSPKFATVYGHVAFQWSLQMRGTLSVGIDDEEKSAEAVGSDDETESQLDYVALSLYFNDGPAPAVNDLQATTRILREKSSIDSNENGSIVDEKKTLSLVRGKQTELVSTERLKFSNYIKEVKITEGKIKERFQKENVGQVIRLSITLDPPAGLFELSSYLNTHTPTPITSFLTANYRARASSKVFIRRSRKSKTSADMESSRYRKWSLKQREDFEEIFNRVMDHERESREKAHSVTDFNKWDGVKAGPAYETALFKKLLIACCDSCQRRAKMLEEESRELAEQEEGLDESDDENTFECGEQNKQEAHEVLANMFFTKVALPEMDYVEDFADFLIDAELNNLHVLKRACEGYLCSELYSKKDLITSLLLDLLFLSIVFNLPVMKSMTLSELCDRSEELAEPDALLKIDEYKSLDRRIVKLSGRNLVELIEEVQRFREQKLRTQLINLD